MSFNKQPKLVCFDLNDHKESETNILLFLRRNENEKLIEITTESGEKLRATQDHPIFTPTGFKEMKDLTI